MSLNISLNTNDLIRQGVEGAAFVAVGTYAFSSLGTACVVYGVGKGTQIATKALLRAVPDLSADAKSIVSWGTSLLAGSVILHVALSEAKGRSASAFTSVAKTLVVGIASILARKGFDTYVTTQPQIAQPAPQPPKTAEK